ncbi:hypothetical protein ACFL2D_00160 [Patescibacteria group bacterium]
MNPERRSMPHIESEDISPQSKISEKGQERREARVEKEGSLAQKISEWWRGDAHTHSVESTREGFGYPDGIYDEGEILDYYEKLGLEFVSFAEHASKPGAPEKQTPEGPISQALLNQSERVFELNQGDRKIAAFSGVEANIMFDENGEPVIDIPDEVLGQLDVVVGSRHAIENEKDPEAIKKSLLAAIRNPNVDVIGHPDRNSRINKEKSKEYWEKYWGVWPEILDEMEKNKTAFEINLNSVPSKKLLLMAIKRDIPLFINYDAHDFGQYKKAAEDQVESTEKGWSAAREWSKDKLSDEDTEILKDYKLDRLSSGPGVRAIFKLAKMIKMLESRGVTPERVVNSSRDRLVRFLKDRGKSTKNIEQVIEQVSARENN